MKLLTINKRRARDPNRDKAFEIYKQHDGKIDLVEIASQLIIIP